MITEHRVTAWLPQCNDEVLKTCNEADGHVNEIIGHFNEARVENDGIIKIVLMMKFTSHTVTHTLHPETTWS